LEDRCRWGHKCMTDKEIGWQGVEYYNLSQDRDQLWVLVNMVMNLQAPYNVISCRTMTCSMTLELVTLFFTLPEKIIILQPVS